LVWVSTIAQIKKRDGRIVPFDQTKIVQAIMKAAQAVHGHDDRLALSLADSVIKAVNDGRDAIPTVEAIQDAIEKVLIAQGHARTAKAFILYRATRSRIREGKSELMETVGDILQADAPGAGQAVPKLVSIGAAASREFYLNRVLSEAHADAHLQGDWHIHGLARYAQAPHGVVLPYRALLQAGFLAGHGMVRPARTAHKAAVATALLLQAAQADCHGGVVIAAFDADWEAVLPPDTDDTTLDSAMTTLVSWLNAMPAQANGQLPATSLHIGGSTGDLGKRVALALIRAIGQGLGRGEPALRPHLVVRVAPGHNLNAGDPHHDLVAEAIALAGRWPGVTFVHDAPDAAYMGHEARLVGEGTGLAARLTLNLPRLALRAKRDGLPFEGAVEEAMAAACEQLLHRLEALSRRPAGDFPLLMAQGLHRGAEGLESADPIGEAIRLGQLGIGVVGLAEALVVLHGAHHGTSNAAQSAGLRLVESLAACCARLSDEHGLRIVLHAAEAEDVAGRFARLDRRQFGMIRGVTETAAYTAGVAVPADAETALSARSAIEGAYTASLPGGAAFTWHTPVAPEPSALIDALRTAVADGHRAFSVSYPVAVEEGPAAQARALVRRRGYLAIE
jgi:ribonucleoside-triphosphate reductase